MDEESDPPLNLSYTSRYKVHPPVSGYCLCDVIGGLGLPGRGGDEAGVGESCPEGVLRRQSNQLSGTCSYSPHRDQATWAAMSYMR